MFGISFTELSIILLIAFLIVGPKKMTEMAYDMGKWLGKIKEQLRDIKETHIDVFDDSSSYSPNIEMNKSLEEVEVTEKEKTKGVEEEKTEKTNKS